MIESITFNTGASELLVTYADGTTREYTESVSYLADHPERVGDVVAMGWQLPTQPSTQI